MEVHLSADQQAFVRQVVSSGRLQGEEEAVQEAFALWEERERRRMEILAVSTLPNSISRWVDTQITRMKRYLNWL